MNELTLRIPQELQLPDKGRWRHRFHVKSETSNHLYVVSQDKDKKFWACSCLGWITRRYCKHLTEMGLPGGCRPYEPRIEAPK